MDPHDVIEFVGGPYDGYRHRSGFIQAAAFEPVALPVNVNLIRAAGGEQPTGPLVPFHRVAIYQIELHEQAWRYSFLREMVTRQHVESQ